MKYMLLIQGNQEGWEKLGDWSPDDLRAMMLHMRELNAELTDRGELLEARGLGGPQLAKTIRAQDNGDPLVTDGPYPESKEVLAGYWVIDVADERRAIEIATRASACPGPGGKPINQPVEMHLVPPDPDVS
jgi:hypothetical protein